jgi:hypothetical protein
LGIETVYSDESYDFFKNQFVWFPGIEKFQHVIGNIYCINTRDRRKKSQFLVNIDNGEIIRGLDDSSNDDVWKIFLMTGTIRTAQDKNLTIMYEFGAL